MKTNCIFLVLLGCLLAGCGSPDKDYGDFTLLMWGVTSYAVTGYDTVKSGLMKHSYAAPGTAYPDFEAAIKKTEKISSVPAEFRPSPNCFADHSFLFKYEGRETVYYGRFVQEKTNPSESAPTFSAGEITNLPSFLARLKNPSDLVSSFLLSRFSESNRMAIAGFPQSRGDEKSLDPLLMKELNAIVLGPSIYEEDRFRGVTLRLATRQVLKVNLNPPPAVRRNIQQLRIVLNRMLLADAYPSNLPIKPWIPMRHYVAIKY
jgi:hypothetical protein